MKLTVLLAAAALAMCGAVYAKGKGGSHYVAPHVTKSGTYVEGHMKTSPNATKVDNYSAKGNVNPYTGKEGTKDPYAITPKPTK